MPPGSTTPAALTTAARTAKKSATSASRSWVLASGPGVDLFGNIATSFKSAAYFLMTTSSKNLFDAVNMDDPVLAAGRDAVPSIRSVGPVHRQYDTGRQETWGGTICWGSATPPATLTIPGLERQHSRHRHPLWRTSSYATQCSLEQVQRARRRHQRQRRNARNHRQVSGWKISGRHRRPVRGSTLISNGYLAAVQDILIDKGQSTDQRIDITGSITFTTLSDAQLRGQTP